MRHVWNQYVIRVPDGQRTALREALGAAKIGTEIYYPLGLHQQQCFRYLGYKPEDLPETARAAEECRTADLPELRADEQQVVVERIAAFFATRKGGHAIKPPKFLSRRSETAAKDNQAQ